MGIAAIIQDFEGRSSVDRKEPKFLGYVGELINHRIDEFSFNMLQNIDAANKVCWFGGTVFRKDWVVGEIMLGCCSELF